MIDLYHYCPCGRGWTIAPTGGTPERGHCTVCHGWTQPVPMSPDVAEMTERHAGA